MVKKKIDSRVRTLIDNGVKTRQRSMFVLVGDRGRDQVINLHYMLSKASVRARPSILWCYKKELGFTTHRKKRMKELKKKIKQGLIDPDKENPFELFLSSTDVRYCYYAETQKILGNTFGMLVLQDFEALTPNILARTIETVEGGGIIVFLLRTVKSLKQLYTMAMDVHTRFRTEAHQTVVPRFNERFLLSLRSMAQCLMLDDTLDVLPWAKQTLKIQPVTEEEASTSTADSELKELQTSLADTQPAGSLVARAKTLDQATALLKFIEAISEKTLRSTVTLTAARGRGKSATLGLAIAAAVGYGYSNIFVTSPSPENLKTLFEFVFKGFDALGYVEHTDYEIVQSTNPDFNKAVVRVNVFSKDHRQIIQYIQPQDSEKLGQAELVVIDEAAAIPLPLVKKLLGPYLVFMASTINGYEGTGRSLSLKLVDQLRKQSSALGSSKAQSGDVTAVSGSGNRVLRELSLSVPIRYTQGDPVESWLNSLLCLDAAVAQIGSGGCPHPSSCELYQVNRDTLFSYNKVSEAFLQRIMALCVASHYKNTPNDLQLLSDAPAHRLFCLLSPSDPSSQSLPEIMCVVQVALEGEISRENIAEGLRQGNRSSGDLIPWTVSQQFQDSEFGTLSGARVVRIATHPDFQGMGYGSRALELLRDYYEGQLMSLDEDAAEAAFEEGLGEQDVLTLKPRKNLPPLLQRLSEVPPTRLDYLGVSFGITENLHRFWKRAGFFPVYLRQTANDLTGEHTCIMLSPLSNARAPKGFLDGYWNDFRRRFISLLAMAFKDFSPSLALSVLESPEGGHVQLQEAALSPEYLSKVLTPYDLKRLHSYAQNMVDFHVVTDLVPKTSRMWFSGQLDVPLSAVQKAILLAMGLQYKTVEEISKELGDLPTSQVLGLFSQLMKKLSKALRQVQEQGVQGKLPSRTLAAPSLEPMARSLEEEQEVSARQAMASLTEADDDEAGGFGDEEDQEETEEQSREAAKKLEQALSQYVIKADDDAFEEAVGKSKGSIKSLSLPRSAKKETSPAKKRRPSDVGSAKKKKLKKSGRKSKKPSE